LSQHFFLADNRDNLRGARHIGLKRGGGILIVFDRRFIRLWLTIMMQKQAHHMGHAILGYGPQVAIAGTGWEMVEMVGVESRI
jgi:hypothetical protein